MLGEGGMGQVYLGVHPGIGSRVAIKLLDPIAASRSDLVDRFFAEAMAVNRIRHENIVNVLDLDTLEVNGASRPYIIMEHLEGQPLSSVLAHFGRLPQGTLTQLIREILGALAAAHHAGIIHRDLKPDNVFVSPQGRAKVLDFGIAKLLPNAALGEAGRFTQTGMLLGTPSYMAPEQARGQTVTAATDLYAVGVILYEASTGVVPFRGETLYELLNKHVTEPPIPPRSLDPSIAPSLEAVILRALAKDQAHRFSNANEMSDALVAASAMFPPEAWASISLAGDSPALIARPTPSGNAAALPEHAAHTPASAPTQPRRGLVPAVIAITLIAVGAIGAALYVAGAMSDESAADDVDASAVQAQQPSSDAAVALAAASVDGGTSTAPGPPTPVEAPPPDLVKPIVDAVKPTDAAKPADTKEPTEPAVVEEPDKPKLKEFKSGPGITVISTAKEAEKKGFKPFTRPAGVNTKAFNAIAFLPKAKRLAREMMSDAELIQFDVEGVSPSGRVNLHKSYGEASFWFRSKKRSKRDPNLPRGTEEEIACVVYVDVNRGNVEVYAVTREKCTERFDPAPLCSLAQLWKKAYARGAPKGTWIAKVQYDKRGWFFDIADGEGEGDDFTESFPDDC